MSPARKQIESPTLGARVQVVGLALERGNVVVRLAGDDGVWTAVLRTGPDSNTPNHGDNGTAHTETQITVPPGAVTDVPVASGKGTGRGTGKENPAKLRALKATSHGRHQCPECGRTYKHPQHLGRHRKMVHGVASQRDRARGK